MMSSTSQIQGLDSNGLSGLPETSRESAACISQTHKTKGKEMSMTKEVEKKVQSDFDLHVLLIIRQDELSKAKAVTLAYYEGTAGLLVRLNGSAE